MSFDMHVHTTESDGSFTPSQIVEMAAGLGLSGVAITDHDAVSGIDEAIEAGRRFGVNVVPGVELSCKFEENVGNKMEAHILGYFLDYKQPEFASRLLELQKVRTHRAERIVAALRANGINIDDSFMADFVESGSVGRGVIGRELVQQGFVSDMNEAFEKWLEEGRPAYVSRVKVSPAEGIELIHAAGGVAVLAHPVLNHDDSTIPRLVVAGLQGLEVYHPAHDAERSRHYRAIAEQQGLLITGGSDCHDCRLGEYWTDNYTVERLRMLAK